LARLAELGFAPQFSTATLAPQFAGKFQLLDGGRARITYEFDKPAEFGDFVKLERYLPDWNARRGLTHKSEADTALTVEKGKLRGTGLACYRLELAFEAPVTARYGLLSYCDSANDEGSCMICLCDDGKSNYLGCEGLGGMRAIDLPSRTDERDYPNGVRADPDHEYAIEMRVADGRCSSIIEGVAAHSVPTGPRTRGDVVIAIHSDCEVELGRLEIEGALDIAKARSRWVAKQLSAIGLAQP
jgi:hypothetical protein